MFSLSVRQLMDMEAASQFGFLGVFLLCTRVGVDHLIPGPKELINVTPRSTFRAWGCLS